MCSVSSMEYNYYTCSSKKRSVYSVFYNEKTEVQEVGSVLNLKQKLSSSTHNLAKHSYEYQSFQGLCPECRLLNWALT